MVFKSMNANLVLIFSRENEKGKQSYTPDG